MADVHRDEGGALAELKGRHRDGGATAGEGGEGTGTAAGATAGGAPTQGRRGDHAGPGEELPRDEEGEEPLHHVPAAGADAQAVILVVAVGVAEVVGVVLDEEDLVL